MFIGNTFVFFAFQGKDKIDSSTRQIVVWTLSVIAGAGLVIMVFFPKPPRNDEKSREAAQSTTSEVADNNVVNAFKGAVRLFLTRNMLLLSITFVYTGQFTVKGFWFSYNCLSRFGAGFLERCLRYLYQFHRESTQSKTVSWDFWNFHWSGGSHW